MTCREKLAMEHPDRVGACYTGGCSGCPDAYEYMSKPENCSLMSCRECWDREIPESKNVKNEIPWKWIKEMVDEGVAKRDREFHLYFNPDAGWSINVYPWPESTANQTEG